MKKPQKFQGSSIRFLLPTALRMIRARYREVAIAAAVFALIVAAASTFINARVYDIQDDISMRTGLSQEDLLSRVNSWATETSDLELFKFAADFEERGLTFSSEPTKENAARLYVLRSGPYILGLLAIDIIVFFLAFVYFLVFFADPLISSAESAKRFPREVIRMIGLLLWMMVRSFCWIPIAGPIIALYFYPRFVAAPALLIADETSIRQSVAISMDRATGKWFVIVGRLAYFLLFTIAMAWVLLVLAGVVSLFLSKLGFLLWLMGLFTLIAFSAAFFVVFGLTLEERKKGKK